MGSNTEKKPWTNLQNSYKNWNKEVKSDKFCYRKVGRAITKWGAVEKSTILLSKYWKNYQFLRVTKIISHSDGSNNIFADCISLPSQWAQSHIQFVRTHTFINEYRKRWVTFLFMQFEKYCNDLNKILFLQTKISNHLFDYI